MPLYRRLSAEDHIGGDRRRGYLQYLTYQPADRYWPFQFIEAGVFLALAAALVAVTFAVINRRDA